MPALTPTTTVTVPYALRQVLNWRISTCHAAQPNAAKLSLDLPVNAWDTPETASYIAELLYRNSVDIIDALLGQAETVIVVIVSDGHVAYNALRQEIAQEITR